MCPWIGILVPIIGVLKNRVIWRQSLKSLSLDLSQGTVFDRSRIIDAKDIFYHVKATTHLASFIKSAVVRRGYL